MTRLRAVIFDLDGTLIDSLADLAASMNAVLAAEGLPGHQTSSYKLFIGDGVANLVRRALAQPTSDPQTLERCLKAMRCEYAKRYLDTTRLYDGIAALLDTLSSSGVPMNVLSNKPQHMTCRLVEELLASWSFVQVLGAAPEYPRKPDPRAALAIAKTIAVEPSEVLYLGDTGTDMATATAAGMYAVGATWGFRESQELLAAGADKLVQHPSEVESILQASQPD